MADAPEQPKTTKLDVVPDWAAELTVLVKRVSANVDNVISAVDVLRDRVNAHDARLSEHDARAGNVSDRVKGASQADLQHEAQLAEEKTAREALAAEVADIKKVASALTMTQDVQLAILTRLDKIASNPTVKVIAGMVATALLTWLASHGGSLK